MTFLKRRVLDLDLHVIFVSVANESCSILELTSKAMRGRHAALVL